MATLKIKDSSGQWVNLNALKGDPGPEGPKGDSGVHVGASTPTSTDSIWIDPNASVIGNVVLSVNKTYPDNAGNVNTYYRTQIPENADLNNYSTPGLYRCKLNVTANTLSNCPTGGTAFLMDVSDNTAEGGWVQQRIIAYNGSGEWIRQNDNGSWSAWTRVGTSVAVVTETYVSGATGYRIYSDGYIEQWGKTTSSGRATTTVTLPKAMANTNYNITISQAGASDTWPTNANNVTTTSFVLSNDYGPGSWWHVCGF